jgi:hypothetical protein
VPVLRGKPAHPAPLLQYTSLSISICFRSSCSHRHHIILVHILLRHPMARLPYPSQPAVNTAILSMRISLMFSITHHSWIVHTAFLTIPVLSLRLSCKAGTRVLVVWRYINGRLSAIFILVCSTILVLASSVNLILTSCRHPSSYPSVRIRLRHARPLLGVGRSELKPGLEPGAISLLIATSTSTLAARFFVDIPGQLSLSPSSQVEILFVIKLVVLCLSR